MVLLETGAVTITWGYAEAHAVSLADCMRGGGGGAKENLKLHPRDTILLPHQLKQIQTRKGRLCPV